VLMFLDWVSDLIISQLLLGLEVVIRKPKQINICLLGPNFNAQAKPYTHIMYQ
jgi:hypothetical protein